MLKWIRGKRLDLKTTVFLLILAAAGWGVVLYMRAKEFIPEEYRERWDTTRQVPLTRRNLGGEASKEWT